MLAGPILFFYWFIGYWVAKYPVRPVGQWIVRRSPNWLSDLAICAVLALLISVAVLVMAVVYKDFVVHEHYPYPLEDRAMIAAALFGPPLWLALFKGTRHARRDSQAQ